MYQLFVIGVLVCYVFPNAALAASVAVLFVNYKLGKRLEELQTAVWAYLTDAKLIGTALAYLRPAPTTTSQLPTGNDFGQDPGFGIPTHQYQPL